MNWEFLLGLMLPAYGIGFLWVIKIAREDPDLYRAVEGFLSTLCTVLVLAGAWGFWDFKESTEYPKEFKLSMMILTALATLLGATVLLSFPFFRRITRLPPKLSGTAVTEPTPGQMK